MANNDRQAVYPPPSYNEDDDETDPDETGSQSTEDDPPEFVPPRPRTPSPPQPPPPAVNSNSRAHPRYELRYTLTGHTMSLSAVKFSPDGKMLASCGKEIQMNVVCWSNLVACSCRWTCQTLVVLQWQHNSNVDRP